MTMNAEIRNAASVAIANACIDVVMDDDDEWEEELMGVLELESVNIILGRGQDRGRKPPRILNYFERTIPQFNDKTFQSHFRVTREAFQQLLANVAPLLMAKENAHKSTVNVEKQLLMVIWLLATPDSYRSVGERFDVAKSTLWNCFVRVVNALNHVAPIYIKWPTADERRVIAMEFQQFSPLPNIVGAIDGTYVPISAPRQNAEAYINRKCFHGMTLQAIGIPALKFTDCFTGYPSSVSDIRILRNSHIFHKMLATPEDYFNDGEYMLGDKAYPVYEWLIPPFINRGNLTATETRFNSMQAKSRQVIERVFALFFGRLRRMQHLDLHVDTLYAPTILAACVIHNSCLCQPDDEIHAYINEGLPIVQQNAVVENAVHNVHLQELTENGRNRRRQLAQQLQRIQ